MSQIHTWHFEVAPFTRWFFWLAAPWISQVLVGKQQILNKKLRVQNWHPPLSKNVSVSGKVIVIPTLGKFRGVPPQRQLQGVAVKNITLYKKYFFHKDGQRVGLGHWQLVVKRNWYYQLIFALFELMWWKLYSGGDCQDKWLVINFRFICTERLAKPCSQHKGYISKFIKKKRIYQN